MEKTKEELVRQYVENRKEIERLNKEDSAILTQCKSFFGHQVGEIAVYKETGRRKQVGSLWRPRYEALPDKEIRCVLMYVQPLIDIFDNELHFKATFHPIKKDGHVSQKSCYVRTDEVVWTGEIHEDFQNNK